jgi:ankyrin repeat protein
VAARGEQNRRNVVEFRLRNRFTEIVDSLLEIEDVDVNKANKEGQTPLWIASKFAESAVVKLLLGKEGVDINKANTDRINPLMVAMQGERRDVVELLLGKEGVDVESLLGLKGVDVGVDVARHLVNKANKIGKTPLLMASLWGHEKVVLSLLGIEGVDVDKADNVGHYPLFMASVYGYKKIADGSFP